MNKNRNSPFYEEFHGNYSIQYKNTLPERKDFHIHNVFEILLVLDGNLKCFIGDEEKNIKKNDILLFNNMDLHRVVPVEKDCFHRYVLWFDPEFISGLSTQEIDLLECFYFRPFPMSQILSLKESDTTILFSLLNLFMELSQNKNKDNYGQELKCQLLLGQILLFINSRYRLQYNIESTNMISEYKLIYTSISYIHANLHNILTVDFLAKQAYLSSRCFGSVFFSVTGYTPKQYIINCRIQKAKYLLLLGMRVEAVCEKTGFNNLSNFSRTFKKHTGVSPKKYAMNNRVYNSIT